MIKKGFEAESSDTLTQVASKAVTGWRESSAKETLLMLNEASPLLSKG